MDIKPKWIDGHLYRYGELEKELDEVIRTDPESAPLYVEMEGRKQDTYFAKKLLVLPPPVSTRALSDIAAGYLLRAERESDVVRADHYRSRSIEYLKRYLACEPNDSWNKAILFEGLVERLVNQAYGLSYSAWMNAGRNSPRRLLSLTNN